MKLPFFRYRVYSIPELIIVFVFDVVTFILLLPVLLIRLIKSKTLQDYSLDKVKKILIFRTDRIGDFVMTLPAINRLVDYYSESDVELVTGVWNRSLAEQSKGLKDIHYWNPVWISRGEGSESFPRLLKKAWSLRKERYDLAIDFTSDIRVNLLMFVAGVKRRVGYADSGGYFLLTNVIEERGIHRVEQNFYLLDRIGINTVAKDSILSGILKVDKKKSEKFLEQFLKKHNISGIDYIIVHPWGGRLVKTWHAEGYIELINNLEKEFNVPIFIAGGKGEKQFCREIAAKTESGIDISGTLSIEEYIYLIHAAKLFISPDTGPMHLAVALGAKSVTLFGPSDLKKYAPYGDDSDHKVIYPKNMECRFCNKIRKPPKKCFIDGVSICMRVINSEEVFEACKMILRKN